MLIYSRDKQISKLYVYCVSNSAFCFLSHTEQIGCNFIRIPFVAAPGNFQVDKVTWHFKLISNPILLQIHTIVDHKILWNSFRYRTYLTKNEILQGMNIKHLQSGSIYVTLLQGKKQ